MKSRLKKVIGVLLSAQMMFSFMPGLAAESTPTQDVQKIVNSVNGNSYAVIDKSLSWSDSEAACEALGGHLVTITSESEQNFINSITAEKTKKYYWTGGLQPDGSSEPSGGWTWSTGEKMEYTNWESSQPNNCQDDNYLVIAKNIDWNEVPNVGKWGDDLDKGYYPIENYGYICEWESGLVAHYKFDGNANDDSGNGNNGTICGSIWTSGKFNNAISLKNNGIDRVSLPYTVANNLKDFTFSAFVSIDELNTSHDGNDPYNTLISGAKHTNDNAFSIGYLVLSSNGQKCNQWYLIINATLYCFNTNTVIYDKKIHHIVIARKGSLAILYIDGQQVGEPIEVSPNPISIDPDGLIIGQEQDTVGGTFEKNQGWGGSVDELRIYNRALAVDEINASISITSDDVDYPSFNGHVYHKVNKALSWDDANKEASSLTYNGVKGHLATVTSEAENEFIYTALADTNFCWLGGFQPDGSKEPDGGWQWVTGEPWVYTNWCSGQPDNASPKEDSLHYYGSTGGWNDLKGANSPNATCTGYMVEFDTAKPIDTQSIIKNPLNNHSYAVLDKSMTWSYAKEYCEKLGGHLATITSQSEQEFIYSIMANHSKNDYWLGGFQADGSSEPSGGWQWVTKEDMSYTNWISGQPDNYIGENRLTICVPHERKWNDDSENGYTSINQYGLICEWESGLVAHYRFNGNANDDSGNGNNGTIYGSSWTSGNLNNAIHIENNGIDRISLPYTIANNLKDFTFSAFASIDKLNTYNDGNDPCNTLINGANSKTHEALFIGYYEIHNKWVLAIDKAYYYFDANSVIRDKKIHHVVITRKGSLASLYIDGQQVGKSMKVLSNPIYVDPEGLIIGQDQDTVGGAFVDYQGWGGNIDELGIYNRALESDEIKALSSEGALLAHYKFDGNPSDSSGNNKDGIESGTISYTDGLFGKALSLDGSNSSIVMPENLTQNTTMSISMYFKTTQTGVLIGHQNSTAFSSSQTNYVPIIYIGNDGKLNGQFWVGYTRTMVSQSKVNDDKWHNVVITSNANVQNLYLDGNLVGTLNETINNLDMKYNQIGTGFTSSGWPNTNSSWFNFKGLIDETRIYNRALSQYEIKQLCAPIFDTDPPSAPDGLKIKGLTGSTIKLTWTPSSDLSGIKEYRILRDGKEIETSATNEFNDANLTAGTSYTYSVKAVDKLGNVSKECESISATPIPPSITGFNPVSGFTIGGSKTQEFKLIFADNNNTEGLSAKAEMSTDNITWTPLSDPIVGPSKYDASNMYYTCSINLSNVNSGIYYIKATLTDASGFSDTKTLQYTIDRTAPSAPKELCAIQSTGSVGLSWRASAEADVASYKIYRKDSSGNFTFLASVDGRANTSYSDKNLSPSINYTYKITAIDKFGQESTFSDEVSCAPVSDTTAPIVLGIEPAGDSEIGKNTPIIVRAEDNLSLSSIKLQYSATGKDNWTDINEIKTSGTATFSLSPSLSGEVYIRAIAKDTSGNESNGTPVRKYTIDTKGPQKVLWKNYIPSSNNIILNWNDVTDSDFSYFQIEEKDSATGEYRDIGTESRKIGFAVNNLSPDKTYYFRVTAYDTNGNKGTPSDELAAATSKDNSLPVITNLSPSSGYYSKVIHLSGTAADDTGIAGFKFQISNDKKTWSDLKEFTTSSGFSYDLDISGMKDGYIYIRGIAKDISGNISNSSDTAPFVQYMVKNTPPSVPSNLRVTGTSGRITLEWNQNAGDASYNVYRASSSSGPFSLVKGSLAAIGYSDLDVTAGKSYFYKVSAIDSAGNEGASSEAVTASLSPDTEIPKIISIYPGDGSVLPASPDISVLSSDNYSVAKVTLEYQANGSATWNKINDVTLNSRSGAAAFKWNTSALGEGSYTIRATASDSDSSGNVSAPFSVKYTLNLSAPKAPVLSASAGNWSAQLSWTSGKEDDLAGFRIYRSLSSGKNYTQVSQFEKTKASWTDEALSPAHTYYYKVEAIDIYQNSSFSNEVLVNPLNKDSYAPAAEAGDDMQTTEGLELQFDGTKSRDNDGIASYSWDFGDGEKSSLPQPKHIYSKEGQYTVKLTVSDFSGNTASDTLHVTVFKYQESGVLNVTIVDDSTGVGIPGASVVIKFSDDSEMKYITDSQGMVKAAGKIGDCCIYGYKDQYKPNLTYGNIIKNFSTSSTLKLVKGKLIDGKLTVKRMNLEEIVSAGIDPYKPENQWIYKFETHLAFTDTPVAPIVVNGYGQGISGFTPFKITNTVSSNTTVSSSSTSYVYPYVVPNPGHPEVAPNVYYLVIPGEAKWLKEFFEVGLTMTNTSEASTRFVVTDSTAKLNVPDGLTLIPTTYSDSSNVKIGDLNPGETKEVKWVVRGDKKGEYSLDADFNGILQPFKDAVKANFKTDSTFRVWGNDALKMHIDAQDRADKGHPYHVRFGIENVSDTTLYNASIVLKDDAKQNYIYAPDQKLENTIKELPAGKTIWLDAILIPSITGKLDLSKSYTLKTGSNDVNIASDMASHSATQNYPGTAPVLNETHNADKTVTLSWGAVTGATGYRIYYIRKDLYMSGAAEKVDDVDASKTSITLPETELRNYIITTLTTEGEVLRHAITGFNWCDAAGAPVITVDPAEITVGKSNDVMITVNKNGYPVSGGTVDIGSYVKGQVLDGNGQTKAAVTPTTAGDIVVNAYDINHSLLTSKTIKAVAATTTDSSIAPSTDIFNTLSPVDIKTTMNLNGNTLVNVMNGAAPLSKSDYSVNGNIVTLYKGFFSYYFDKFGKFKNNCILTFKFSSGKDATLTVKPIFDAMLASDTANFDLSNPADVKVTMSLSGNTLVNIMSGAAPLSKSDYSVNGNVATINKGFFNYYFSKFSNNCSLKFVFSDGKYAFLTVKRYVNDPSISPNTTTCSVVSPEAIQVTMTLNGSTLVSIMNGSAALSKSDYSVNGNIVTINKSYLAYYFGRFPKYNCNLTFKFSNGKDIPLTIKPVFPDSSISPAEITYDMTTPQSISVALTLNSNKLTSVKDNVKTLSEGADYSVSGSDVLIKPDYLKNLPLGDSTLTFNFDAGKSSTLKITVNGEVKDSTISSDLATCSVTTPESIKVTMALNGNTLVNIMNGAAPLTKYDYSVNGNVVTINKSYFAYYFGRFPKYNCTLTFKFSNGKDAVFTVKPAL